MEGQREEKGIDYSGIIQLPVNARERLLVVVESRVILLVG